MNFLKKLFKKNDYGNALQFENNECDCCNEVPEKLKKCHECNERKICKMCYINGEVLCKKCTFEFDIFVKKLQKVKKQEEKKEKYNYKGNRAYLAGQLL